MFVEMKNNGINLRRTFDEEIYRSIDNYLLTFKWSNMNIQTMNLSRLLNNQHLTFHREFEALIVEKTAATLDVVNTFAAYQQAIEAEDAAMMKIMKMTKNMKKMNMRMNGLMI